MNKKCGYVAIVGKTNAGKSTLLNTILGQKVSITSNKVQTTRDMIYGIYTDEYNQIIFIDTPGLFEPKRKLDKNMIKEAYGSIKLASTIVVLVDAKDYIKDFENKYIKALKDKIRESKNATNSVVVFNKIDLLSKEELIILQNHAKEAFFEENIIYASVRLNENIDKLLEFLISHLNESDWLYDQDDITTAPMRFVAEEITREQIYNLCKDEIPYYSFVTTDQFKENSDGTVTIHQSIVVDKESQKMIILGKNGSMVKNIGMSARAVILKEFELKAHLFIHVKVRQNWDEK
jgi:GTP-binding protein Era